MSYATCMEYPAVSTEDISVQVEGRKPSPSSHQTAKEVIKSHKKSLSAGYFKRPGFLSTKEHIELEPIPSQSDSSSDIPRLVVSESVLPSDKVDGVELLSTSFSEHKLWSMSQNIYIFFARNSISLHSMIKVCCLRLRLFSRSVCFIMTNLYLSEFFFDFSLKWNHVKGCA